ncbi:MAG: histidinol-phosphatase [Methylothermaceae bacteria B42]|nr:MAG: histidinol-phosphatase [Methylothermaceae bacteria B42]
MTAGIGLPGFEAIDTILLDRDGVINQDSPDFIKSPEEWRPLPGSLEAIARLSQAGYKIIVISNQSGLARGLLDQKTLDAIHDKMLREVSCAGGHIEAIYYCPHGPDDDCPCRKPKPGLLHQFAADFHADLNRALLIGDSWRDVEAARAAGAKAVLVKTGKGQEALKQQPNPGIPVFDNLYQATYVLTKNKIPQPLS